MAEEKGRRDIEKVVELPEGVSATISDAVITVKGPKGELSREFTNRGVTFAVEGNSLKITAKNPTKREKMIVGTFAAHLNNMKRGVVEPHVYKLKVCAGHFPMNVSVSGSQFVVKNFYGEKIPRTLDIKEGATVKVEGDIVTVESVNKEVAGAVSADIEQLTKRSNFDTRIFQDGIYITEKDGKELK